MKKANYIISALMIALGGIVLYVGRDYDTYTLDGITTAASWPNLLSILLIVLSVLLAISNAFSHDNTEAPIRFGGPGFRMVLRTILAVLAYTISYYFLGCLISNALFVPVFLLLFGERNWKTIVLYDLGMLAFVYVVFGVILSSRLAPPIFL